MKRFIEIHGMKENDMAVNMQTKLVLVLESRGFVIVRRGKYIVMQRKNYYTSGGRTIYLYIGKSGALRSGTTQASSRALSDNQKRVFLAEYDELIPMGF